MVLWGATIFFFVLGFRLLFPELRVDLALAGSRREQRDLNLVSLRLREVEDALLAGMVPEQKTWDALADLAEPWGSLAHGSVSELRRSGGALSPTLRRLRLLAQEHGADLVDARARSSQAFAQAGVCLLLIPLFAALLDQLMPGVDQARFEWVMATAIAFAMALAGATWMVRLADSARWGGLRPVARPWMLGAYCAIERFLALCVPERPRIRLGLRLARFSRPGAHRRSPPSGGAPSGARANPGAKGRESADLRPRRSPARASRCGRPCSSPCSKAGRARIGSRPRCNR